MFSFPKSNLPWLQPNTIFLTRHGSHAYGTNTPTSDEDFKGIAIPPPKYFHGFMERFEQAEFHHQTDGLDMVVYDIRKFFKLAADCNPNIIEVMYADPADHQLSTYYFDEYIRRRRDLFISKKAKHTFSGYAVSQLKKLMRTKDKEPERINPVRAELIEKFGYDTKDAMHVVRLLRMGEEILSGKGVIVKRPDAKELLEIRNGGWKLDDLIKWGEDKLKVMDKLYETSTAIPHKPDMQALDDICASLVEMYMDEVYTLGRF